MAFYQHSWILTLVYNSLDEIHGRTLVSPIIEKSVTVIGSPLIYIERHLVVRNGSLVVFVGDQTHQMYAEISSEAIKEFEFRYHQRLTYRTVNSMMKLLHFDFVFADFALKRDLGLDPKAPIVVMFIRSLEFFLRDQVERAYTSRSLVYNEKGYIRRCKVKSKSEREGIRWDIELLAHLEENRSLVDRE